MQTRRRCAQVRLLQNKECRHERPIEWQKVLDHRAEGVLLLLYLVFLLAGFSAARKLKETYAALLVYGLTMLISVQGIVNIAMVIGCFPVTGIPLPFISYGGSSLLMNIISVALIYGTTVQSLRETDLEERKRRIAQMEGRG